ncbi:hypothetical protein QYE76_055456 [Lolium multiflorum]|uniref:Reverse transcriptase Ty1/copia-type domain-containing protein n=1 Tax=Lolium multiflorum TaxID=4521 RepID=A0AAD8WLW5_LOLMU|nr:hypothetical protein QYE76_055456 [Lolium multiflorum]
MATSSLDTSIVLSTQEEYSSGDDDGDDEEDATSNGLVALASLSTNPSSPSESPNEVIHVEEESCLMAKSSEVSSPNPSMPHISSDLGVDDASLKVKQEMLEFDDFILNLQGSKWVLDSGCTSHMTGGKNLVKELRPNINNITVSFGDNSTSRFEMSMMGEMKFFLGFEIKQLRGGTFINQAKYLQDMLKRFKMTELKGVATPMVTKCHLALDPNALPFLCYRLCFSRWCFSGGRRRSRHDRSSDEFAPNAPRKSVTSRRKNKEVRENYKTMDPVSYSAIRLKNWYDDVPRDEDIAGRRYWCAEQEFIFKDIYEPMKNLRPMQAIDVDILAINNHFEDAIWVAGKMGLHDIMKIQCDFSPDLVKQFFATLAIRRDEEHTMEWMTGSAHCSATLR